VIARVRGTLVDRSAERAVVDVAGVGYQVTMTARDLAALPSIGQEVVIHTHLHVREDVLALYGFVDAAGRDLFGILLGASGIGPKIAVAMLATLGADGLRAAVLTDDVPALTAVPGIGTRTAQKLILDLRGRLDLPDGVLPGGSDSSLSAVRDALEGLGYGTTEIRDAMSGLDATHPLDQLLRSALQRLGRA
jgi:holliday junction DNA helicase RuvA